ncbi:hypothetical protein FRC08_013988 [Ceratobasidium sp. 394]|nr:hypothetical protein FRC08_013988 [Ceratobasidium sp. 394]
MGDPRPPPQPIPGAPSLSSSSVPSMASTVDDQTNTAAVGTSPSGRLTFVFPSTRPRPAQQSSRDGPLVECSSSELLPSSSELENKRQIMLPRQSTQAPLRLIAEDALGNIFGPSANRGTLGSAPKDLEAWVTSSRQTIIPSNNGAMDGQDKVGE